MVQIDKDIESGAGQVQATLMAPVAVDFSQRESMLNVLAQLQEKFLFERVHLGIFLLDTVCKIQDFLVNLHADVLQLIEAEGPSDLGGGVKIVEVGEIVGVVDSTGGVGLGGLVRFGFDIDGDGEFREFVLDLLLDRGDTLLETLVGVHLEHDGDSLVVLLGSALLHVFQVLLDRLVDKILLLLLGFQVQFYLIRVDHHTHCQLTSSIVNLYKLMFEYLCIIIFVRLA